MASTDLVPRPAVQPPSVVAAPFEQPKKPSESSIAALFRSLRRNRHVTVPLAVPLVLWLSALVLYIAQPAPYVVPLCGAMLSFCVWVFAPHKWDRPAEQWYARLSVILAALW